MPLRGIVSSAQAQGSRDYQEDYLVHMPFASARNGRGHLIGVMDGHGGEELAKYCAEFIPRLFDPDASSTPHELKRLIEKLNARTMLWEMGSTISLACVNETKQIVTTAVLGDSPIIVLDQDGQLQVSEEHNVRSNIPERDAAIERGAIYADGYIFHPKGDPPEGGYDLSKESGLQLSRALGDHELHGVLNRNPTISEHRLGSSSFVLVSSDGLFDPSHEESDLGTLKELLAKARTGNAAKVLRFREEQDLDDNTSVIIWRAAKWWNWFR